MTLVTSFIIALPFLNPSTIAIEVASYAQAGSSLVPGYIGPPTTELNGDFLINTFCYCAPEKPGGNASHYYQTDYFNIHLGSTFILHQTCLAGHNCGPCHSEPTLQITPTCDLSRDRDCTGFRKDCLPANLSSSLLAGTNQRHWGRKWFRLSWSGFWHGRVHDHLTYWPNWEGLRWDVIEFNGHKRDLSMEGGQGMVVVGAEEAERVCGRLCEEQIGTEVLRGGNGVMLSHQSTYGDVDDMCDGCK